MHAPPYKCSVQVPARMIGKDQNNLNRSHHSSVKAVSRGGSHNIHKAIPFTPLHFSIDIYKERDRLREQAYSALHVLYRPHSIFLPPFSFSFEDGPCRSKGMVFGMSPDPTSRLVSERGREAGRRASPARQAAFFVTIFEQKIRESRLKIHA